MSLTNPFSLMSPDNLDIAKAMRAMPAPAINANFLNNSLSLLQSGNALVNPVLPSGLGDAMTDVKEFLKNPPTLTDSMGMPVEIPSSMMDSLKVAFMNAKNVTEVTNKMTTDVDPFSPPLHIPDEFHASMPDELKAPVLDEFGDPTSEKKILPAISSLGVPSMATLMNVAQGQQALEARLGKTSNPCKAISDIFSGVMDGVKGAMSAIGDVMTGISNAIKDVISLGADALQGLLSIVSAGINTIINAAQDVMKKVADAISNVAKAITEQFRAGIATLIKGLSDLNPCANGVMNGENGMLSPAMKAVVNAPSPTPSPSGRSIDVIQSDIDAMGKAWDADIEESRRLRTLGANEPDETKALEYFNQSQAISTASIDKYSEPYRALKLELQNAST